MLWLKLNVLICIVTSVYLSDFFTLEFTFNYNWFSYYKSLNSHIVNMLADGKRNDLESCLNNMVNLGKDLNSSKDKTPKD
jgi:hypothetical protein